MPLHLAQRIHAIIGRLGKPSEDRLTRVLYAEVEELFSTHGLLFEDGQARLVRVLTEAVCASFDLGLEHPQVEPIRQLVGEIIVYEGLFQLPDFQTNRTYRVAEHYHLREELSRQKALFKDLDQTCDLLRLFVCHMLDPVFEACPTLLAEHDSEGITVPSELTHLVSNMGAVVETIAKSASATELIETGLLSNTQGKLDYNLIVASGGHPRDPAAFSRTPKYPSKSDIGNPKDLLYTYLGGTPLVGYFDQQVAFTIPTKTRFEHHHIVAGSGHGKTQTLQYLISRDLEAVEAGRRSVVVIDSQGDLIDTISNLAVFREGGSLADRIVIIDPTDVEWPVSLNLFDVGQDRLAGYSLLEQERLTNSILELYDFVLGSLLEAGMTQKQNVIFRYVTRLMMHIPNATIHTLRELMEEGSEPKFQEHFVKLTGSARHFFETEFPSR